MKQEYVTGLMYELNQPVMYIDKGKTTTWNKGEKFVLTANKDRKVGPCFVSLLDGSLLALKVIKKISKKKPVMIYGFKTHSIKLI